MLSDAQTKPTLLTETQQLSHGASNPMMKKIWLPKVLYDVLPYFYLTAGFAALFTTFYINDWFWVLPHYMLFSAACLHLGVLVYRRRNRKKAEA